MAKDEKKPDPIPQPEPPKHLSQTHGRLVAAFQTGPDALPPRGAALLAAHAIRELGEALTVSMTEKDCHVYVSDFIRKHPMLCQALKAGNVAGFVHRLPGNSTAGGDEKIYQHMMTELLWESPQAPVIQPGSLVPNIAPRV